MGYTTSPFRDFESSLRIVVGLDDEDIQLILKQYNSHFITYELTPGIYTIQDISDAIHKFSGHEGRLKIVYNDVNMKTKLVFYTFGHTFGSLRFSEKSFFNTILGFAPGWDYKLVNIHSGIPDVYTNDELINNHPLPIPGIYTGDKILNLSITNKIHLKFDVIDGSVVNGVRQPILFSFVLDKKPGYKVFCEPETIHYKKINKSVLKNMTFYLEHDNNEDVNFHGETLTFALRLFKI